MPTWLGFDAGTRTFSGTPTNADAGTYTIEVTADDSNGGTVTDIFTLIVVASNAPPTVNGLPVGITIIEDIPGRMLKWESTMWWILSPPPEE